MASTKNEIKLTREVQLHENSISNMEYKLIRPGIWTFMYCQSGASLHTLDNYKQQQKG